MSGNAPQWEMKKKQHVINNLSFNIAYIVVNSAISLVSAVFKFCFQLIFTVGQRKIVEIDADVVLIFSC